MPDTKKDFMRGLEEFFTLQEGLGCPYASYNNYRELCSIDERPCRLKISFFGPYCNRHGSSPNMDLRAGRQCWKEFFIYTAILSYEEKKKIFKKYARTGDVAKDGKRWDSLLNKLKEAAEAARGGSIKI